MNHPADTHQSLDDIPRPTARRRIAQNPGTVALLGLCAALAVSLIANYLSWAGNREQLQGLLVDTGVADFNETAVRGVSRERTAHHAQLLTARALVHEVMSVDVDANGEPVRSVEEQVLGLQEARELSRQALRAQPNSWQASMLLGASRYLEWSLTRDRRLFESSSAWEEPLRQAVEVTGGKAEPRRMLAAAYLETWWALSPAKKQEAKSLLRDLFEQDQRSFTSLSPRWLQVARKPGSRGFEEAFEIIPDQPTAWAHLRTLFRRQPDWRAFVEAHQRWLESLRTRFRRDLDEARERLRLGDFEQSRTLCIGVLRRAPRQLDFVPLVVEALEIFPPGLRGLSSNTQLQGWLRWSLELDGLGIPTLTPQTVKRIADAAGDLAPAEEAQVALMGNDPLALELFERRARAELQWRRFLLRRARQLTEAGALEAAAERLSNVDRLATLEAPYWLHRQELARAVRAAPDSSDEERSEAAAQLEEAASELAKLASEEWTALMWKGTETESSLQLFPGRSAPGLELVIAKAPATGEVVDILWDGARITTVPVAQGQTLRLEIPVEPKMHLLEVRSVSGSSVLPGEVRLSS